MGCEIRSERLCYDAARRLTGANGARNASPRHEVPTVTSTAIFRFNPTDYNPREWAKLAKAAGMKYAVLTSRHHDGFCMFDSHFTDYKVTNSPYGKDAVREFLEAFRAEGLKVGLYHSLPDWAHPGYADTESPECIAGGKKEPHVPTPEQYASFTNLVYNHINQLTTEYGKLDLLFLHVPDKGRHRLLRQGRHVGDGVSQPAGNHCKRPSRVL